MSDKPTSVLLPKKEDTSGKVPCTAMISIRNDQALFSLDCPALSNMKVLGQAAGKFPLDLITNNLK